MTSSSLMKCVLLFIGALVVVTSSVDAQLSTTFYASKCPNVTAKVADVVKGWIKSDRQMGPALLRLYFHDCFVRGCDASALLDGSQSEKQAAGNLNSLRGFNIIDDVKAKVEAMCPGVVSCADILALSAKEAMEAFGGITWTVTLGRRDGTVSSVTEANNDLPPPFANFTQLVSLFAKKGLTMKDMVILSGAHSVGFTRCATIQSRLYSFSTVTPTDPTIEPSFATSLKKQCKQGDQNTIIKMDQSKSTDTWDFNYYSNVIKGKVVFQSDQTLRTDSAALKIVQAQNKAGGPFNSEFQAAMLKLGNLGVLTGKQGQIRKKCNKIN
ncbi:hypothetical protein Mapa_010607 [Marchantia paleacea]|nr:hypothetical protein Mapa_010607 [Marchantia paleacea]